jgi:SNF2 family DNA or RNA helicase
VGIVDAQAARWVRAAQALRSLETLPPVDPVGLRADLRSYQRDGFRWLVYLWRAGLGGILADDMGLGKTLQTLALVAYARGHGSGPFLVIAPTSVVATWAGEAATFTPGLTVRVVTESASRRGESIASLAATADVVVTSYTLFRLEADAYVAQTWGGVVLDEAQLVKNHQGKTYQAVRRLDVPFRLALTGTPMENRLMELWSLLSIVAPGLYPWPQRFLENVANPVERLGDRGVLERFRRRIRPFLLRRTKDLVAADLPAKQEQVLEVALTPRHRRVYETHLQRERQTVLGLVEDFDRHRIAIFRSLTRLRQLSLDAALVDDAYDGIGSAKVDVLVDHLVELAAEGHRALVFSQFTSFLARVRQRLDREGIASSYLDGSTRHRPRVVEGFKRGDDPVFLISLKAGGVGLTLTEADYVFVLDPWWNPAVEAQAVDRTHRIGQQRQVFVYRLVSTNTIEEKVMALKDRKAALFAHVVDQDALMAAPLGADDVRALFSD